MRNSPLVESLCADDVTGLRHSPKLWFLTCEQVREVGERTVSRRRRTERDSGGISSENAGMSSEKIGENPIRRKSKVSRGRLVHPGEVGS